MSLSMLDASAIKTERLRFGLSRQTLAEAIGVSSIGVWRWETGAAYPNFDNQCKIVEFFAALESAGGGE